MVASCFVSRVIRIVPPASPLLGQVPAALSGRAMVGGHPVAVFRESASIMAHGLRSTIREIGDNPLFGASPVAQALQPCRTPLPRPRAGRFMPRTGRRQAL